MNNPNPIGSDDSTTPDHIASDAVQPSVPGDLAEGVESTGISKPVAAVTSFEAASLSLTVAQRTAIIRLTSGATRVDAATAAGVTRTTLYRWLNHDPAFQVAYNIWQRDLVSTAQGQLLAASQDAIATVVTAIRRGDARLAWKLLSSLGLAKPPKPGVTDLRQLQRQQQMDAKREEVAERKEANDLFLDDALTLDLGDPPLG